MSLYTLQEIVDHARSYSPFYKNLYAGVPQRISDISELPLLDAESFWQANQSHKSEVLTSQDLTGLIFKSGGTTNAPRFSIFTREEWEMFCRTFGRGMSQSAIQKGDRIANVFYVGDLYASFLFIMKSIELSNTDVLHLPISGAVTAEQISKIMREFRANVIAGVPTTIMQIVSYLVQSGQTLPEVTRIIFGGEPMYPDQRRFCLKAYPNAHVQSIGYASVDGGLLGYADAGCECDEHRPFIPETILEIVDEESGEPIRETGRPGKVLLTNLTRKLMPIIRYPAGDRAYWTEYSAGEGKKFILVGRSEEGARVGVATLYYDDFQRIISGFRQEITINSFQLVVHHHACKDALCVRILAETVIDIDNLKDKIIATIYQEKPLLDELVKSGIAHPLQVEFVDSSKIEVNPRTGKIKRVIDLRKAPIPQQSESKS